MKKFLIFILIMYSFPVFAFEYSETDKELFYDAFLDGYYTEMEKSINQLDIEQNKKEKFLKELKRQLDREDLVSSSWNCIQKYPLDKIVSASVICTAEWNKKQAEKNKKLFKLLK